MMRKVLAIGSHPDDIELGCGGTLLRHISNSDTVSMLVVTDGEAGPGDTSTRLGEQQAAADAMGATGVHYGHLPDGLVSNCELQLVHLIERVLLRQEVDTVYTHHRDDTHQDHRAVSLATCGAARWVRNILFYESPSSVHFAPSVFVDITEVLTQKVAVLSFHTSQLAASRSASIALVRSQGAFRGHQARTEFAEGFVPHRMLLSLDPRPDS